MDTRTWYGKSIWTLGLGKWRTTIYQSGNAEASNGTLKIIAKKSLAALQSWGNTMYSSSRIKTDNKFTVKYGKIEARIKTVNGEGFWPAFWMLPLEAHGQRRRNRYHGAVG